MKKVSYYVADDGRKFDDKVDCQVYELELQTKSYKIQRLDIEGEPTNDWEKTWYYSISDISSDDLIIYADELYNTYGVRIPTQVGTFFWDTWQENWRAIPDYIKSLKDDINNLTNIMETLS